MSLGRFYDEVVISEPGNLQPRRVPVASIQVSWEISAAGSFSGFVRRADMQVAGLTGDLKGYWLDYATSAGRWGGIITGQPTTGSVVELVAQGWITIVQGRLITTPIIEMGSSAGGLARRALTLTGAGNPNYLAFGVIDEGGAPLAMELTGDVASDILPQIAEAGDVEWLVDADRVFHLSRKLGRDRSALVRLVEDRHIVQARVNDDLASATSGQVLGVQGELSQDLTVATRPLATQPTVQPPTNPAVPMSEPPALTRPAWEPRSTLFGLEILRALNGLLEGLPVGAAPELVGRIRTASESWQSQLQSYDIDAPGVALPPATNAPPPDWASSPIGIGAHNPAVPSRRNVPLPTVPVELTLANTDGCFLWFDLGDTVRIDLGSTGTTGRFRVQTKGLDVTAQTLTVAGELLKDA